MELLAWLSMSVMIMGIVLGATSESVRANAALFSVLVVGIILSMGLFYFVLSQPI